MRKILTVLAVAMVMANANGCCCRRLCPWLDNGSSCCLFRQQPAYAPVCQPTYAQAMPQQYMTPAMTTVAPQSYTAAPVAQPCCAPPCAPPCAPACAPVCPTCTSWDPCQCAIVAQPQPTCCPQQPVCCPAPQPVCYSEPSCAYDEGMVGYGPSFGGDCGMCGSCSSCGGGGCESGCGDGGSVTGGGVISAPAPDTIMDPGPATE